MLPSWEEKLQKDDIVLIGCDEHAKEEMELITNNFHEFEFAYVGREYTALQNLFTRTTQTT